MPPLTPVVTITRGFAFQLLFLRVFRSGSYLVCLCLRACYGNLSWQYVNSINFGVCVNGRRLYIGVWLLLGAPIMHRMHNQS